MHHTTRIFLEGQGFEPEEVSLSRYVDIDKPVPSPIGLENVWIGRLANLTLELLPAVGDAVRPCFYGHLLLEPELEAFEVDKAHGAIALARVEQGIDTSLLGTPAHFALNLTC